MIVNEVPSIIRDVSDITSKSPTTIELGVARCHEDKHLDQFSKANRRTN